MMADAALSTHTAPVILVTKGDTPLDPRQGTMSPALLLPFKMAAAR